MATVDRFIFLDDVQLEKQSWQTRNRVLVGGHAHWIVAPIKHLSLSQTIADTPVLNDGHWRKKLVRLLRQEYARHPFSSDLNQLIQHMESLEFGSLADLNISLIEFCAEHLGITTQRMRAADMALEHTQRTRRLVEMCERLGCGTYISPIGAADYLAHDGFANLSNVQLEFFQAVPPPYPQKSSDTFQSHLSIVDVVANLGWSGSSNYICDEWKLQSI